MGPMAGRINAQVVKTTEYNRRRPPVDSSMNEPQFVRRGSVKRMNWCVGVALIFFTIVIVKLVPTHPFLGCLKSKLSKPESKSHLDKALLGRSSSSPIVKNLYK